MIKAFIVLAAVFGFSVQAVAVIQSSITGTITKIRVMGDGTLGYNEANPTIAAIYIDGIPTSCGGAARVAIRSSHPSFEAVVSAAMTVQASGRAVTLYYTDTCTANWASWDFSTIDLDP